MIQAAFKPVKSLKAQVRQPFVRQPFDDSIFSFSESLQLQSSHSHQHYIEKNSRKLIQCY